MFAYEQIQILVESTTCRISSPGTYTWRVLPMMSEKRSSDPQDAIRARRHSLGRYLGPRSRPLMTQAN